MFTRTMRWSYLIFSWLLLGAVILQFFFAGLGVFGANNFELHRNLGYALLFIMVLGLILAALARLPGRIIGLAFLLPVLVLVQSFLVELRDSGQTTLAALHVVNGLAIFTISGYLALRSRQFVPASSSSSIEAARKAVPMANTSRTA